MNVVIAWSFLLVMVVAGMSLLATGSSAVRVPVRVLADLRSRRRLASRRGGR